MNRLLSLLLPMLCLATAGSALPRLTEDLTDKRLFPCIYALAELMWRATAERLTRNELTRRTADGK